MPSFFDEFKLEDIPGLLEEIAKQDGQLIQRETNRIFAAALYHLVEARIQEAEAETEEPDPVSKVRKASRGRKSNSETHSEGAP